MRPTMRLHLMLENTLLESAREKLHLHLTIAYELGISIGS